MNHPERQIPPDTVWKVVFEISHAPQYIIQLPNRYYVGCYAPVESVMTDNSVPFGISPDKIQEYQNASHIQIISQNKESTPFNTGVYNDRIIPSDKALVFCFPETFTDVEKSICHAVIQLDNGLFLSLVNSHEPSTPVGISKDKVVSYKENPQISIEKCNISQTPFRKY